MGANNDEKLGQHALIWFGHNQYRPPDAPLCRGILRFVASVKKRQGHTVPILT